MTGSRARGDGSVDEVSDYDIEVFTTDRSRLEDSGTWIEELTPVWVCLPTTRSDDERYAMRLVVFEGGTKVDFALAPVAVLEDLVESRRPNDVYQRGYRVLLDKDGLAAALPAATGLGPRRPAPSQDEFRAAVEEFWFEASHIPKLLGRGELWVLKLRDWTMKQRLLQMIEWHAAATAGDDHDTWHIGTRMATWAGPEIWTRLHGVFGHFDAEDSGRALVATAALYRELGEATAQNLGYDYPGKVADAITGYIDASVSR